MHPKSSLKKLIIWLLVVWLLPTLACNYPGRAGSGLTLPAEALRQTLAAQVTVNPQATGSLLGSENLPHQPGVTLEPGAGASQPSPATIQLPVLPSNPGEIFTYLTQSGDTLTSLGLRFNIDPQRIAANPPLPAQGFLIPGQQLSIPNVLGYVLESPALIPDSEAIYSPTSRDFDPAAFVQQAGGYLAEYQEWVDGRYLSGAEIIQRVASEASVSPRLLLAFLEYRSGWVFGQPANPDSRRYPLGFHVPGKTGLYQELVMAGTHLNIGYYGQRYGKLPRMTFKDGQEAVPDPRLNAGTLGVQNLFAKFYRLEDWSEALYGPAGFVQLYYERFGDPWQRAAGVEPLFLPGMQQPALQLPFTPGERWSLTGGPHAVWNSGSPRGAIDFAPVTGEESCAVSRAWVTAPAPGVIARAENNVVALDLDGDGDERTGWVLVFLHIANEGSAASGARLDLDDRIGHPSCERGNSTGTNVHIGRKYNGEWLAADGPLPMELGGWLVQAGPKEYLGTMTKNDKLVTASPVGPQTSIIVR